MLESEFQMIDVGEKKVTRRRALAQGCINMSHSTLDLIKNHQVPKGNVLAMAEAAGIMAAKNTPQILPLCHPLILDQVKLNWKFLPHGLSVESEVLCHGKTGVEMEALVSVQAALLCVYDMTKMLDDSMLISNVHLVLKEGGKSNFHSPNHNIDRPKSGFTPTIEMSTQNLCSPSIGTPEVLTKVEKMNDSRILFQSFSEVSSVVLTLSDRAFRGAYKDESGPILSEWLRSRGAKILNQTILEDDPESIRQFIKKWTQKVNVDAPNNEARYEEARPNETRPNETRHNEENFSEKSIHLEREKVHLMMLTGGTGLSPRDHTPQVLEEMGAQWIPGIGERLRQIGAMSNSHAWLSRMGAAVLSSTLIVMLPGSPRACRESLGFLEEILPHALSHLYPGLLKERNTHHHDHT